VNGSNSCSVPLVARPSSVCREGPAHFIIAPRFVRFILLELGLEGRSVYRLDVLDAAPEVSPVTLSDDPCAEVVLAVGDETFQYLEANLRRESH
jgi:hypothetical protein